jgi:hypothetical protein
VQVVDLVLEGAREQPLAATFEPRARQILRAHRDLLRALERLAQDRHAQAALRPALLALARHDLGVREHDALGAALVPPDVDHRQALAEADLGRGEPDPLGVVHRLEHVFDERVKLVVKGGDGLGARLEGGVAVKDDGLDHGGVAPRGATPL